MYIYIYYPVVMLKYILLGFLSRRPRTGYELKSVMEQTTMHFWHAYHSQIYTTLRKLEEDGLVVSELEDGDDKLNRRRYELTDAGRADLKQWLDTPMSEMDHVKEGLLVRVFFSDGRDRQAVIDELSFQRQLHQHTLDEYRQIERHLPEGEAAQVREIAFSASTLRFGIAYEQLYLRWLDETMATIQQLG